MKRISALFLIFILLCLCVGCSENTTEEPQTVFSPEALEILSDFDQKTDWDNTATKIGLDDGEITVEGEGAVADENTVTISAEGTYILSGTLSNGTVVIDAAKTDKIHLIFNGVRISSKTTAPVAIFSADKVVITLAEGSENTLSDITRPYRAENEDEVASACLYAEDDLTVNGTGSLAVEAANNGIDGKNDVRICGGTVQINAVNNGLKGKDSVVIAGGTLSVRAGKDGIKSDNETEEGRGTVHICGGETSVTAKDDGIQAFTEIKITSGDVHIQAEDKKLNCDGEIVLNEGYHFD